MFFIQSIESHVLKKIILYDVTENNTDSYIYLQYNAKKKTRVYKKIFHQYQLINQITGAREPDSLHTKPFS